MVNLKKFTIILIILNDYPFNKFENIKKNTIDEPSFNKLSPSKSILNLIGVPNSFNKATTATGSVALIIAENANENGQLKLLSYPIRYLNIIPVNRIPIKTPGIAKIIIYYSSFLNINGSILNADSNIIVGINIYKIPYGFIFNTKSIDFPISPKY